MKYFKYPRTYHFPWSPGTSSDDRILTDVSHFVGKEVIVTEKLDGENTSMYDDHVHARSLDSVHHPSRNFVKVLHSNIKSDIPKGFRICGENVYAKHSILYEALEDYFYVFGIYDEENICLSWDSTVEFSNLLELKTVPVLYRGIWDENIVKSCFTGVSLLGGEQEGYVCRIVDPFPYDSQDQGIGSIFTAKYVRKNHVQTSEHWMNQKVIPNLLRK